MFDFSIVTTFIDNLLRQTLGLGDFLSILIECVLVGVCILTAYALTAIVLIFMERKVCAYFQCRLGPMRVGPWGIFQVFADVLKMLIKEIFAVDRADKLLYYIAPFLVIIASVGTFSFLPWEQGSTYSGPPRSCIPHHCRKFYRCAGRVPRRLGIQQQVLCGICHAWCRTDDFL